MDFFSWNLEKKYEYQYPKMFKTFGKINLKVIEDFPLMLFEIIIFNIMYFNLRKVIEFRKNVSSCNLFEVDSAQLERNTNNFILQGGKADHWTNDFREKYKLYF